MTITIGMLPVLHNNGVPFHIKLPLLVMSCKSQRGIGQYFEILFLAEFHLSCKMQPLIYEYKKKNSKIPSEN